VIRKRRDTMESAKREKPASCSDGEELSEDQRALLVAMLSVDAESEKGLEAGKRATLDELKEQVNEYDTGELTRAAKHMVTAKSQDARKVEWPELRQRRRKGRSSGK
jgi:hypothetical protein